ncbi:hypothetical protein GCM10027093_09480 [Paraburkholderia jirisanensis]
MKHSDFRIGLRFLGAAGHPYLCTDVGTRIITAIAIPDPDFVPSWDAPIWFQGPPYILSEEVFDEQRINRCQLSIEDTLQETAESIGKSAHPGFHGDDHSRVTKARFKSKRGERPYPPARAGVLRFDRVRGDGEILHPYAAKLRDEEQWTILALELFDRQHIEIDELEFIALARATEDDLRARAATRDKNAGKA